MPKKLRFLPSYAKKVICSAFFLPDLTYYMLVRVTTTKQTTQTHFIAQNKVIQHMLNVSWCAHADEYFKKFNIIKLAFSMNTDLHGHTKPPFYHTILPSPKGSCFGNVSPYNTRHMETWKHGNTETFIQRSVTVILCSKSS